MEKLDFGKKLIDFRKAKGLTQEEVAERCGITVRTIQRIESGLVEPRTFTIKIISETLGFDFFETFNTVYEVNKESQNLTLESHKVLWHLKDLFNLKTNPMKKITIISSSLLLIAFLGISLLNAEAQSRDVKKQKSLIVHLNKDKSIKRIEVSFTRHLTLDSLVQIRDELRTLGITINYKKIEFNLYNSLSNLECEVISNDGFSGAFGTGNLHSENKGRVGFYRDYTPNIESPFGTGGLDIK